MLLAQWQHLATLKTVNTIRIGNALGVTEHVFDTGHIRHAYSGGKLFDAGVTEANVQYFAFLLHGYHGFQAFGIIAGTIGRLAVMYQMELLQF